MKVVSAVLVFWLTVVAGMAMAEPLGVGQRMPNLSLAVPEDPAARQALGVEDGATFSLLDLPGDLLFIEVIGVYCPVCVKQAPGFKTLFTRLNRGKLKGRVNMLGLAAGASSVEVRKLLASGQYAFPVVADPEFAAHLALGEPLTPYTMICRPNGDILFTHLGVVKDIDGLYQQIKGFLD